MPIVWKILQGHPFINFCTKNGTILFYREHLTPFRQRMDLLHNKSSRQYKGIFFYIRKDHGRLIPDSQPSFSKTPNFGQSGDQEICFQTSSLNIEIIPQLFSLFQLALDPVPMRPAHIFQQNSFGQTLNPSAYIRKQIPTIGKIVQNTKKVSIQLSGPQLGGKKLLKQFCLTACAQATSCKTA